MRRAPAREEGELPMTVAQDIQKDFERSFGTACFIAWLAIMLFRESDLLLGYLPCTITGTLFFVGLLGLCSRYADAVDAMGPGRLSCVACIASMLGVVVLEVAEGLPLVLAGGVLISTGSAAFLLVFGKNMAFYCHDTRLPQLCAAFFTGALLVALVSALDDAASLVVTFLMPLLCALHLCTLKSNAGTYSFANLSKSRDEYQISASTLFTTGITGFMWGIAFYLVAAALGSRMDLSLGFALPVACGAAAGIIDCARTRSISEKALLRLFATVAFVGLAPLPFVPDPWLLAFGAYLFAAFTLDTIVCVSAMGEVAHFNQLSPYWVFGKSLASYFAGAATGLLIYAMAFSGGGLTAKAAATGGVLLLIVWSGSFVFQDRYPADGGLLDLDEARKLAASESRPALWQRKIDAVIQRYELTARQQEVFRMLVRGRNAPYIAETFVISISTAKAHIHNIYRKLDVHSQQELINLVEEAEPTTQ